MKITLISNPPDAPCCVKIVSEDGQDRLIQTDFDFPGIASCFGWSTREVQKCDQCGEISTGLTNIVVKYCRHCPDAVGNRGTNVGSVCSHSQTDGTVPCPDCGILAGEFIHAARLWIDENDEAQTDDPGYFEPITKAGGAL